jgi:hypothetical protein
MSEEIKKERKGRKRKGRERKGRKEKGTLPFVLPFTCARPS